MSRPSRLLSSAFRALAFLLPSVTSSRCRGQQESQHTSRRRRRHKTKQRALASSCLLNPSSTIHHPPLPSNTREEIRTLTYRSHRDTTTKSKPYKNISRTRIYWSCRLCSRSVLLLMELRHCKIATVQVNIDSV